MMFILSFTYSYCDGPLADVEIKHNAFQTNSLGKITTLT